MMFFHRLSFVILFIPIAVGIHTEVSKVQSTANNSETPKTLLTVNNSATDFALMSEGGSIAPEEKKSSVTKAINTTTILKKQLEPLLDSSSGEKSNSVARKGATLTPLEDIAALQKLGNGTEVKIPSKLSSPAPKNNTAFKNKLTGNTMHKPTKIETTPGGKKPSILSYEALKSIVPDESSLPVIKMRVENPGSHPGMVMPVVITVLVVPMFAVLGYMALRRGQEAWKNRHYKRMDFLLDGMYND